jgi:DNA polymerase-1
MSKYSVKDRFDMDSIQEAEDFVNQYKKTLNTLFAWEERMKKNARKNGTVYTYFGRPRRLKWYFNHDKSGMRAFAYRSAINSPIQGAGSDILKIALIKLWDNVFTNPKYKEDVLFMSTVHDEINFSIRKSKMEEIVPVVKKYMEISVPGWQIDMEADCEFGSSWGQMFEFEITDDGEYAPVVEPAEDHDM